MHQHAEAIYTCTSSNPLYYLKKPIMIAVIGARMVWENGLHLVSLAESDNELTVKIKPLEYFLLYRGYMIVFS